MRGWGTIVIIVGVGWGCGGSSEVASSAGGSSSTSEAGSASGGAQSSGEASSTGAATTSGGQESGAEGSPSSGADTVDESGGESSTAGGGTAGGYEQCDVSEDCAQGFSCVTIRENPRYGQCTRECETVDDCLASPTGGPVGCHPEVNMCFSLCGVHGGQCAEWLECVASETCLEPVDTVPTKEAGERCNEAAECLDDMECIELGDMPAYCSPKCTSEAECMAAAEGAQASCIDAGGAGFQFCLFNCPPLSPDGVCPGDLACTGGLCT